MGLTESKLKDFVMDSIRERRLHSAYLRSVQKGANDIEAAQKKHKQQLDKLVNGLKFAVETSEEGSLPTVLKTRASDHGATLTMANLEKQMKALKRRSADDEPLMYPSQTVSLAFMRGKKIIARIGDSTTKSEFKAIYFSFSYKDSGDWDVKVLHKESARDDGHVILTFQIAASEIEDMKRAGKTAKAPYHDGWVVFNCFYLVQLLSRIASTMA